MQPLIETDELAQRLADPTLRIYDCTTSLRTEPDNTVTVVTGRAAYLAEGHIPGAALIELQQDLSDASSGLRFTMPAPEALAKMCGAKGIGDDSEVVVYCNGSQTWATRVWWMLRSIGFDRARVLNGGFVKWRAEGRPVETAARSYPPARLTAKPRAGLFIGKEGVLAGLQDDGSVVVNCLTEESHRGAAGGSGRLGHITGSVNVPAGALFAADGTFRSPGELSDRFAASGVTPGKTMIAYCGGGIAACADAFALVALLGRDSVTVYDNSLQEWAADPALPMSVG